MNADQAGNGAKLYGSRYLVHRDGRIYRMCSKPPFSWELMKPTLWEKNPAAYYHLCIDGRTQAVHRIVAKCFCPNPNGYNEVNHIDGNKLNNAADNLEWCSRVENVRHAFRTGLITREKLAQNAIKAGRSLRRLPNLTAHAVKILIAIGYQDFEIRDFLRVPSGIVNAIRKGKSYRDIPWD